jgi:hypothetical protein
MGGLGAVARALNAGDMVRASIAAVHLRLPPLDWPGAVRIAEAHDLLKQYDPNEPRDARGRWTTEGGGADADAPLSDDPANPPGASDPYALPDDWVRLPPGERIDELGDLLEWIANAKPEDEPAIRAEITRIYYDVGDARGGDALNRALSDAVEPGVTQPDREAILRTYEHYTRADPAEVAQSGRDLVGSGLLHQPMAAVAPAVGATRSGIWALGWAARGERVDAILGHNLSPTFPVIDNFGAGIATSNKSIDLAAATYQDVRRLSWRINDYLNKLANFEGAKWGNDIVEATAIRSRQLKLAVPQGADSPAQRAAISAAIERAKTLGIALIVIPM